MNSKKKIMLFLGAVSLVAFGNYRQFVDNNRGKTTVEGKASEKATSSKGGVSKEGKVSEKATSSAKNNPNKVNPENKEPMAEVKSVPQPQPNKTVNNTSPNTSSEAENNKSKNPEKSEQKEKDQLRIDSNKNVEDQFKLNPQKSKGKK